MNKKKMSAVLLILMTFILVFTGVGMESKAALPESNIVTHYSKYGDKARYFDDGYIYYTDRFVRSNSGTRWHFVGWRVKVTANGRTSYVDYSTGEGYASGFTKRSSAYSYKEANSGGYYYQRYGLNYNYLIRDITAKNKTLGRDMSSGDHDVKIVFDSITEVYDAVKKKTLDGPNYTASSTKSALKKYGMGTSLVDDGYGITINIAKSQLPIVVYKGKNISFPDGGGYSQSTTTHYVKPGKMIYVDSIYRSQKVNLAYQYFRIGDPLDGSISAVDDYISYYRHSDRKFIESNGSTQLSYSTSKSSGPSLSNANSNSTVRQAFSLKGSGDAWYVYAEAQNENGIYEGGSDKTYKQLYIIRTDDSDPTYSALPSTAWTNSNVTFTPKASDSLSGLRFARIKQGGTTLDLQKPASRTTSISLKSVTATSQTTYVVDAEDNVGNASSKSFTVNIDKGLPTMSIAKSTTAPTNGSVVLTATASDSLSGVASVKTPSGSVVSGTKATYTATQNGTYTFRATDKAGNIRDVSVSVTNIDKTAPTGTLSQTPTAWTNGNVTLNLTGVSDSGGSGLKNIKLPNGSFVTGTSASYAVSSNGTYSFVIYDNAGNSTTKTITVSNIDKSAPNGNVSQSPTSWTNGNVNLTLSGATDTGGSGVDKIKLPNGSFVTGTSASQSVSSNGTYSFVIYDKAGNTTTKSITVSNIDKISPTANLSQTPTAWTKGNVTLNLTSVNDTGGSGLKNIKLPDGSFVTGTSASYVATSNGTYSFTVYDNAGNAITKSITVSNIDRTAPTGLLTRNPSAWTNGNVVLTLSGVTDSGSGVKQIVRPDGSTATGSSATQTVTSNGTYTFKMIDNVGNESTRSIVVNNIDKIAPSASFSPNGVSWTKVTQTVNISTSDSGGSDVKQWRSRLSTNNGSSYSSWSGYSTAKTGTMTLSSHGLTKIQIEVTDVAGNVSTVTSGTYYMDRVQPTGSVSASTTSWTNGSVVLTATASDEDSGMSTIKRPDGSVVSGSSTTYTVTSNGTYNFVIADKAGNERTISRSVTNIDKSAPTANLTQTPTDWTSGNVTLNLTSVSDTGGAGVKDIRKPDGSYVTGTSTSHVVSANGTYSFVVRDNAGNSVTKSITVTNIDKTAPTGTLSQTPTSWTKGNVTLNLTGVSDSQSGVDYIKLPNGNVKTGSSASYTVSSNGTYTMEIVDGVGNKTTRSITVTNIDKVAPSLALSYDYVKGVIKATASDAGSGILNIKLPNGNLVTATTATYEPPSVGKYTFVATDKAGNATSRSISLDAPEIGLDVDTEEWTNQNVTITAEGYRSVNPIDYILLPNGQKVSGDKATYIATSNGTYTFKVYDTSGFTSTGSITVSNIDKVKPSGTATFIPGSSALTIRYDGTDSLSGVKEIVLPNNNGVDGATASYNVTKPGTYTAIVEDNAGNKANIVATVQAPSVTISPEITSWTNHNSFGLTATTAPRYVTKAKMQAGFASSSWVTDNKITAQISKNGTYEFKVNDGGIVSSGTISITNFDREQPIITFEPKAKTKTDAIINVKIKDMGDVK